MRSCGTEDLGDIFRMEDWDALVKAVHDLQSALCFSFLYNRDKT